MFILPLIPGAPKSLYNEQQQIVMIDTRGSLPVYSHGLEGLEGLICERQLVGSRTMARVDGTKTIEFRFLPSRLMGGTGGAHWLCTAHSTQAHSTVGRSGPLALPCSHTRVSSGCAYIGHGVQEICASTVLLLCFYCASTVHSFAWAEWLGQRRKGAGTERRPLVERKESGKSAIEIVPPWPDDT